MLTKEIILSKMQRYKYPSCKILKEMLIKEHIILNRKNRHKIIAVCLRKTDYKENQKEIMQEQIKRLENLNHKKYRIYKCIYCPNYHIGHINYYGNIN